MTVNKGRWIEIEEDKFVRELAPQKYAVALVKTIVNSKNEICFYELSYKIMDFFDTNKEVNAELAIDYVEKLPINLLEQYHKISDLVRINQILNSLGITKYTQGSRLRSVGDCLEETFNEMEKE